ncbi:hypothetical protein OG806_36660 [Streptomyces sp. NBC_00882]|uniref:hypothetical protein n=1 Tax=Streptomyces TaxID=1883 RepID=UPI0038660D07|nr:hypothetical protein OG806_36660 [Streptomyces sp. NBC_00882]WSZ61435.1 hypothetical protein OH824_35210 [Streptomyces canus]
MLVVLEGPARVLWKEPSPQPGAGDWTPTGIWPDEDELAMVREHIERGLPLLVLLDEAHRRIPLLRQELRAAPCRLLESLMAGTGTGTSTGSGELLDDEVVEVRLPFLDWLPDAHRDRAARFLEDSDAALSRTPVALLPPLMTEERQDGLPPSPRFARRILPNALTAGRLAAAVEHLFVEGAQHCAAAGRGSEADR